MIQRDTIFTNVAVTEDNQPWWEGSDSGTPVKDWQGQAVHAGQRHAAHPNSRFTVSAKAEPDLLDARGCAGRRADLSDPVRRPPPRSRAAGVRGAQLVARRAGRRRHGVRRRLPRPVGQMGVVRRDSMAMKPFCGYNFGDYWKHWLSFAGRSSKLPRIFHVNWFRQDKNGRFMWPGYGENLRVLRWITDRCEAASRRRTRRSASCRASRTWMSRPESRRRDGGHAAVRGPGGVAPRDRVHRQVPG
jgi:phosphoenolpyruvate carboxykinase (GTP)